MAVTPEGSGKLAHQVSYPQAVEGPCGWVVDNAERRYPQLGVNPGYIRWKTWGQRRGNCGGSRGCGQWPRFSGPYPTGGARRRDGGEQGKPELSTQSTP